APGTCIRRRAICRSTSSSCSRRRPACLDRRARAATPPPTRSSTRSPLGGAAEARPRCASTSAPSAASGSPPPPPRAASRPGRPGLWADQGIAILSALLADDGAQVLAIGLDRPLWAASYPRLAAQPFFAALADGAAKDRRTDRGPLRRELFRLDPRVRLHRL